jgi:sulfur relay (sulfurtransferase) DsrC/TusE family protein
LTVIDALSQQYVGGLSNNVWKIFQYLRDSFANARIVDPSNTNNVISDDLSALEKGKIRTAAGNALNATNWSQIVV